MYFRNADDFGLSCKTLCAFAVRRSGKLLRESDQHMNDIVRVLEVIWPVCICVNHTMLVGPLLAE